MFHNLKLLRIAVLNIVRSSFLVMMVVRLEKHFHTNSLTVIGMSSFHPLIRHPCTESCTEIWMHHIDRFDLIRFLLSFVCFLILLSTLYIILPYSRGERADRFDICYSIISSYGYSAHLHVMILAFIFS
jgi:hypothetical protein